MRVLQLGPLAFAVLLLLPGALAAGTEVEGQFTSPHITFETVTATSSLAVFSAVVGNDASPGAGFAIQAKALQLEIDHTDLATGPPTYIRDSPEAIKSSHRDATIRGTVNRNGGIFLVAPLTAYPPPQVQTSTECLEIVPPSEGKMDSLPQVQPNPEKRPLVVASLDSAVRVAPCSLVAVVSISGAFMVQLWEWDALLQDASGQRTISTGFHADQTGVTGTADEAWIFVESGTITMPVGAGTLLYLEEIQATAQKATAKEPQGTLRVGSGALDLQGKDVEVQGRLKLEIQGTGAKEPPKVSLDGQDAFIAGAASTNTPRFAPPAATNVGAWLVGAVIAAVLASGGLVYRERRHRGRAEVVRLPPISTSRRHAIQLYRIWITNTAFDGRAGARNQREQHRYGLLLQGLRANQAEGISDEEIEAIHEAASSLYEDEIIAQLEEAEGFLMLGKTTFADASINSAIEVASEVKGGASRVLQARILMTQAAYCAMEADYRSNVDPKFERESRDEIERLVLAAYSQDPDVTRALGAQPVFEKFNRDAYFANIIGYKPRTPPAPKDDYADSGSEYT